MKYLIVNTLPQAVEEVEQAISELSQALYIAEVIHTEGLKIHGCIGCNDCWLKTPGICTIQDDYQQLLINFLQVDRVLFIAETRRGFVSYQMKDILDRILPLATMYLKFCNGQMRHYSRYKKQTDMGILITGDGDLEYLNTWMDRVMLNLHAESLGVYELCCRKELCHALGNR